MKNRYWTEGDVTYIALPNETDEDIVTMIDTEDLPRIMQMPGTWYAKWDSSSKTYYVNMINNSALSLHRCVMDAPSDLLVDHICHDTLDNRKSQLRLVTPSQNQWNQKLRCDNKSGEKGVCWNKKTQKWDVKVKAYGKRHYGGSHKNLQDAIDAVRKLRAELHSYDIT